MNGGLFRIVMGRSGRGICRGGAASVRRGMSLRLPLWCMAAVFGLAGVWARGVSPDDAGARRIAALASLREAADSGMPEALRRLAWLYEEGLDSLVTADPREATRLYGEAARRGDAEAAGMYGYRLMAGLGCEADTVEGVGWIRRAAEAGDPRGANNLGWLLSSGTGVAADSVAAVGYYLEAARAGLGAGAFNLVGMITENPALMPDALSRGEAYRLLGAAYSRGQGVPYDYERSMEFYLHSAVCGDREGMRTMQELLEQMPDALQALPLDSLLSAWPEAPTRSAVQNPGYWSQRLRQNGVPGRGGR